MTAVPAEAIDAAYRAAGVTGDGPKDRILTSVIDAALDAAAPLIAAAAWRAGYGQGRDDEASGLPLREGLS